MKIFFAKHPLVRKLLATLGIIAIFLLGRRLPVPNVDINQYIDQSLKDGITLGGGSLAQIGLFSLGLGPMMYGMLLNQLFAYGKRHQSVSPRVAEFRKNLLILVIAVIQGLALAINLNYSGHGGTALGQIFEVTLVLVAGAFVIMWLGNLNAAYGFGGAMLLMLISMISNQFGVFPMIVALWKQGKYGIVAVTVGWLLMLLYLAVIFDKAEYRIPVERISIHNKYAERSYLPIKIGAGGGMVFMYAYTFLSLPNYLIMLLVYFRPDWGFLYTFSRFFSTANIYGVIVYLSIIAVLTIVMAFVAIDAESLAEGMRASGDFIPFVRSGKPTKKYILRYVRFFAYFNALYIVIIAGVPMLASLVIPELRPLTSLVGIFMMMAGLVIPLIEEVKIMRLRKQYVSLFD